MANKRILVADDSLTIQKVIRLALSSEGYEIEAVSDGNDASQQIPLFRPDIVLVDVGLPGKSAYELKREYNQDPDKSPVQFVLMSSAFEDLDEKQIEEVSFEGRLVKPFDPAHLRQVLDQVSAKSPAKKDETPVIASSLKVPPPEKPEPDEDLQIDPLWQPSEGPAPAEDEDIRQLTESTIEMSGLDKLEWNLDEPGRVDAPPTGFKPPPMPEMTPVNVQKEPVPPVETFKLQNEGVEQVSRETWQGLQVPDPTLQPKEKMMDTDGVTIPLDAYTPEQPSPPTEGISASLDETKTMDLLSSDDSPSISAVPVDTKQIENIVTQELRESLQKIIQDQLPEIAERVIREEIHRMLSESSSGS